ncbi:hypothetical protein U8335_19905 [Roseiconus lacunae]|uniref:hypothetical protein n=1 Tax=Roseiconus lacunae TaxID=2605694 RepID=UPI0030920D45|nr:hypothetical protein U8335_19905 [Stieleria sp. HD01]
MFTERDLHAPVAVPSMLVMFYRLVLSLIACHLCAGFVSAGVMYSDHVDHVGVESIASLMQMSGDGNSPSVENLPDSEMTQHDLLSGNSSHLSATLDCRLFGRISPELAGKHSVSRCGSARDPWLITILKPA